MRVHRVQLHSPEIGAPGTVVSYGHAGRPLLVFASEAGRADDFANNGMVGVVADLVESGRVRLYCVDSFDTGSWSARHLPLEDRARRHGWFESWIVHAVVPHIRSEGDGELAATGCSMGAFHALNTALRHSDIFGLALCFSGSYDPTRWNSWGEPGDQAYLNNPTAYVMNLSGEHLDRVRSQARVLLVCGQGQWEDTTGALESTRAMAGLLAAKGIPFELDLWGYDVPHDWPSWRAQFAHHLPRFC